MDLGSGKLASVLFRHGKWPRFAQFGTATPWPRRLLVLGPVVRTRCVWLAVCGSQLFFVFADVRIHPLIARFRNSYCFVVFCFRNSYCSVVFYYFQLLHPGYPTYGPGVAKLTAPPVAAW